MRARNLILGSKRPWESMPAQRTQVPKVSLWMDSPGKKSPHPLDGLFFSCIRRVLQSSLQLRPASCPRVREMWHGNVRRPTLSSAVSVQEDDSTLQPSRGSVLDSRGMRRKRYTNTTTSVQ